jgi:hemerythrin-like domain-containing protein
VTHTLQVALEGQPHEVAASFCHGRENLLPDVLSGARDGMSEILEEAPTFKHYLERHITLDHDEHGPLALRLLAATCADNPTRIAEAERVGVEAVQARSRLWDGTLEEIMRTDAEPALL